MKFLLTCLSVCCSFSSLFLPQFKRIWHSVLHFEALTSSELGQHNLCETVLGHSGALSSMLTCSENLPFSASYFSVLAYRHLLNKPIHPLVVTVCRSDNMKECDAVPVQPNVAAFIDTLWQSGNMAKRSQQLALQYMMKRSTYTQYKKKRSKMMQIEAKLFQSH